MSKLNGMGSKLSVQCTSLVPRLFVNKSIPHTHCWQEHSGSPERQLTSLPSG